MIQSAFALPRRTLIARLCSLIVCSGALLPAAHADTPAAVSYTHLTLPTICSV